jgi:hypothetical protein
VLYVHLMSVKNSHDQLNSSRIWTSAARCKKPLKTRESEGGQGPHPHGPQLGMHHVKGDSYDHQPAGAPTIPTLRLSHRVLWLWGELYCTVQRQEFVLWTGAVVFKQTESLFNKITSDVSLGNRTALYCSFLQNSSHS